MERNASNNNAIPYDSKERVGAAGTPIDSRTSSVLPKAPVGTPYTPKTPYKDKHTDVLEESQSSPDAGKLFFCHLVLSINGACTFALEMPEFIFSEWCYFNLVYKVH